MIGHTCDVGGIDLERLDGGRLHWMDLLRGIAILLVLVWHAPAIPALFDWPVPDWLQAANNAFLPFRMPTLMFLSGLLLPRAFAKGWREYYIGKIRTLVWPYVLWVLVYVAQYGSQAPLTSWHAWYGTGYLWFLFFITAYYFAAPLVTKLLPAWLIPWLFMLASIPLDSGTTKRLVYFATYFFLGYWFATSPRLRGLLRGWVVVLVAVIAISWGAASAVWGVELAYRGEFAPMSICGILFATWLAHRASGRWVRPVTFVGRNSIVYYVSHFPVMSVIVMSAISVGWVKEPFIWVPNLLIAAAISTLLALGRKSPWIAWLFVMPTFLIDWARARPAAPGGSSTVRSGMEPNN